MAKQTVPIIDSSGKEFHARLSWAERKRKNGECVLDREGKYRFAALPQHNSGADPEAPRGAGGRMTMRIALRPDEPTPYEGFSFLAYPMARGGSRGSLASRYPALARDGAGMR
jgi:hypothetical protein